MFSFKTMNLNDTCYFRKKQVLLHKQITWMINQTPLQFYEFQDLVKIIEIQ